MPTDVWINTNNNSTEDALLFKDYYLYLSEDCNLNKKDTLVSNDELCIEQF